MHSTVAGLRAKNQQPVYLGFWRLIALKPAPLQEVGRKCALELSNSRQAAKDIATETGLEHRPVADGQRVAGTYRRSVMLASGRYAMLDDGMGFSLVPWKPVIEQRLGQRLAATVRGSGISWQVERQLGI